MYADFGTACGIVNSVLTLKTDDGNSVIDRLITLHDNSKLEGHKLWGLGRDCTTLVEAINAYAGTDIKIMYGMSRVNTDMMIDIEYGWLEREMIAQGYTYGDYIFDTGFEGSIFEKMCSQEAISADHTCLITCDVDQLCRTGWTGRKECIRMIMCEDTLGIKRETVKMLEELSDAYCEWTCIDYTEMTLVNHLIDINEERRAVLVSAVASMLRGGL